MLRLFLVLALAKNWRKLCRVLFGLILAPLMILAGGICKLLMLLPLSKACREGYSLWVLQLSWRFALLASPWIRIHHTPRTRVNVDRYLEQHEAAPSFVLSNHVSFFDTLLVVTWLPCSVLWKTRCYMGAHLYKIPVLGAICRACGHFPVHFTSDQDGKFGVDKIKMQTVEIDVKAHIDDGGVLALFPGSIPMCITHSEQRPQ